MSSSSGRGEGSGLEAKEKEGRKANSLGKPTRLAGRVQADLTFQVISLNLGEVASLGTFP